MKRRSKRQQRYTKERCRRQAFAVAMRKMLRSCDEWHGTVGQLQRQFFPEIPLTQLGRCVHQSLPSLIDEFFHQKRTLEEWGIVHFFKRMDGTLCRTEGCSGKALARGRCGRCFRYLHRHHRGWSDDAPLMVGPFCRFHGCENRAIDDPDNGVFCPFHTECVEWRIRAEEILDPDEVWLFPWDPDWLSARYFHTFRRRMPPAKRPLFNKTCGNTPLFKIFMELFDRYDEYLADIAAATGGLRLSLNVAT